MKKNKQKRSVVKQRNNTSSSELLQALRKLISNGGGSVSYVFVTDRLKKKGFINKKGEKDFTLEPYQKKCTLHCNIGPQALISNNPKQKPGSLKTHAEIIGMFETTRWDLGANYFIID